MFSKQSKRLPIEGIRYLISTLHASLGLISVHEKLSFCICFYSWTLSLIVALRTSAHTLPIKKKWAHKPSCVFGTKTLFRKLKTGVFCSCRNCYLRWDDFQNGQLNILKLALQREISRALNSLSAYLQSLLNTVFVFAEMKSIHVKCK